jgi:macrodomain Ter protein organizer (MatP/YcbG family)
MNTLEDLDAWFQKEMHDSDECIEKHTQAIQAQLDRQFQAEQIYKKRKAEFMSLAGFAVC